MSDPKATALALIDALEALRVWSMTGDQDDLEVAHRMAVKLPSPDAIRSLIEGGAALAELMGRWSIRHDPHNRESKRYELMVIGADRIFYGATIAEAVADALRGGE